MTTFHHPQSILLGKARYPYRMRYGNYIKTLDKISKPRTTWLIEHNIKFVPFYGSNLKTNFIEIGEIYIKFAILESIEAKTECQLSTDYGFFDLQGSTDFSIKGIEFSTESILKILSDS